jgi:hypothetical protein
LGGLLERETSIEMAHHWEQYIHTLIPDGPGFAPQPQQVAAFFDRLAKLGSAPLQGKLRIMKPSGECRSGTNPKTGETISFPMSKHIPLENIAEIRQALEGLSNYTVIMGGQGPARLPPFELWTQLSDGTIIEFSPPKTYGFQVACCLKEEVVSTSDWDDETSVSEMSPFGRPWNLENRIGVYRHPSIGAMIKVPNAGYARFWVEFEFGRWLFPPIKDTFDVLEPSIVICAEQSFGSKFVQGCRYY